MVQPERPTRELAVNHRIGRAVDRSKYDGVAEEIQVRVARARIHAVEHEYAVKIRRGIQAVLDVPERVRDTAIGQRVVRVRRADIQREDELKYVPLIVPAPPRTRPTDTTNTVLLP